MDELNSLSSTSPENLSKCCKCNDAPGDFILDSCMHSLCNYCVATCLEIRDNYNCPKCLSKSKISSNIYLPILNRQSVERCSWCEVGNEENTATGYCSECDTHLCPECIRGHCRMPQFRSHHIQLNTEADGHTFRNCDSHPNEALDIYCETCEKLTCRDCQLSLHKEHKHQWIGEKAPEIEQNLQRLHDKITDKMDTIKKYALSIDENRTKLSSNVQVARKELENFVDELKMSITDYFNKLETELDVEANIREKKLSDVDCEVTRSLDILQHCFLLLNKLQSSREPSLLIQVTPRFLQTVNGIMERLDAQHKQFDNYMATSYADCCLKIKKQSNEIITDIGEIKFGNIEPKEEKTNESENQIINSINYYDQITNNNDLNQWPIKREFCCVCNDGGFVICCTNCAQLYHQACHVPRLIQVPSQQDWMCTICTNNNTRITNNSNSSSSLQQSDNNGVNNTTNRLTKRERRVVATIFLELLCFHDWTIFISDENDVNGCSSTLKANNLTITNINNSNSSINNASPSTGNELLANGFHNSLDFDQIRFNIENKIYTNIDSFVEDLRMVFEETARKYKTTNIKLRVSKFQEKLDMLLQKFVN